jgi:hypothetical protein
MINDIQISELVLTYANIIVYIFKKNIKVTIQLP